MPSSMFRSTTKIAIASKQIAKKMKKPTVFLFIVLPMLLYPTLASAEMTWGDVAENNLREVRRTDPWLCDYVSYSVRDVTIIAQDDSNGTTLLSARYDYRCGDSTSSDTVYMSFSNGGNTRTCHAYALKGQQCTLDGRVVGR